MNEARPQGTPNARKAPWLPWGLIVLASVALVATWAASPASFYRSYLFSYVFWLGIPAGMLMFALIHDITGGAWGRAIRPALDAGVATFPLMALLFLPIAFGHRSLYEWARDPGVFHHRDLADRAAYLNSSFFLGRSLGYVLVWLAITALVMASSRRVLREVEAPSWQKGVSSVALLVYILTASFAAIDWVMSLEPNWYSTVYGLLFLSSQALAGMAFVILLVGLSRVQGERLSDTKVKRDIGSLLAVAVLLWAYLSFSQLIVIWQGDTKELIAWVLHRSRDGFGGIAWFLVFFHFGFPFFLLLFRRIKDDLRLMAWLALGLLIVHLVEEYWFVVPAFPSHDAVPNWQDLVTVMAMGGVWIGCYFLLWPKRLMASAP